MAYDADGLLTAAGSLTLARDPSNGLLTGTSLISSGTTQSYNSFGEVSHFSANQGASAVLDINYQRDDLGRIVQKTETIGGLTDTYAYGYDTAGRLTLVGKNGSTTASYAYDAQDRLLTYGTKTYTYTVNGELLTKTDTATSQTTQYTYDALGNLNTVLLPDGRRVDYLVDGRNRRVAKKVNGAFTKKFLYGDQLRIAAELSSTNTLVSRFVYATRVNVPDYLVKGSSTYRIVTDHLGSPRLVVDVATGTISQRMDYDEFGRVTLDTNPAFQPFGFAGGLYDPDTGLVRFGARDYDAEAGRWTGKDPIRFEGGEWNLYGYTPSDPINFLDPLGNQGLMNCDRDAKGLLPGNHGYLWDPATDRNSGRGGMTSGGQSQKQEHPRDNDDSCRFVPGTEGKEKDILDWMDRHANDGIWFPYRNDCHRRVNRALKEFGVAPLPSPNGRFGRSEKGGPKPPPTNVPRP